MLDFMLYLPVDLHVDLLHLQFGMHRVEQICRFSTPMAPVRTCHVFVRILMLRIEWKIDLNFRERQGHRFIVAS